MGSVLLGLLRIMGGGVAPEWSSSAAAISELRLPHEGKPKSEGGSLAEREKDVEAGERIGTELGPWVVEGSTEPVDLLKRLLNFERAGCEAVGG